MHWCWSSCTFYMSQITFFRSCYWISKIKSVSLSASLTLNDIFLTNVQRGVLLSSKVIYIRDPKWLHRRLSNPPQDISQEHIDPHREVGVPFTTLMETTSAIRHICFSSPVSMQVCVSSHLWLALQAVPHLGSF